jgi:hypothetical protein
VVTSPTNRCGTTLVQRLITGSHNAFVYGEEIGQQLNSLTEQFLTVIRYCEINDQSLGDAFQRALSGTLEDWRPGLAPPAQVMLEAWVATYYQLPATLSNFGQTIGRPVWGFKLPAYPGASLRAMLLLMPRTQVVYVVRHPADALKSAKARKFVNTPEDAETFCRTWANNLREALAFRDDPRLLWIRYEDLVADKTASLARIGAFAGVEGMSTDTFALKVNTFAGAEADGHSPTQYIAPAPLTRGDIEAVDRHTGPLTRELYPENLHVG